jgi:hypothetical protein
VLSARSSLEILGPALVAAGIVQFILHETLTRGAAARRPAAAVVS